MADVLISTWQGGGAMHNALRIGRELACRGHLVRVSAPSRFSELVARFGCAPVPHPAKAEFDPGLGRAMDFQSEFMKETFFGPGLADAVRIEADRQSPDVVVVDYLLRSVMIEVEALDLPAASLVTMAVRKPASERDPDGEWGWRWQYDQVNRVRRSHDLAPLPVTDTVSATIAQACRARRVIATLPRELDSWLSPPDNVVYVGPIDESRAPAEWHSPWPDTDGRPLVVVTLGTMYMGQESIIERVLDALDTIAARVLVLTGDELEPGEVASRPDVRVESYVPHESVLPHARLVISHGGMGTLLECLKTGVPNICIPLGRDQHNNARAAAAIHATTPMSIEASTSDIRAAIAESLASTPVQKGVRTMTQVLASYGGASAAADEIERLCT